MVSFELGNSPWQKEYKIQVSNDAQHWQDVYHVQSGKTGKQDLFFDDVKARYVKVQGIKRGTGWGYSLWEMKVHGGTTYIDGLSDVHFLRNSVCPGQDGHTISENLYCQNTPGGFLAALNRLPQNLKSAVNRSGKAINNY